MTRTLLLLVTCLVLLCGPRPAIAELETAVFAGGCFWCLEHDLEDLPGVRDAVSGYSGGHVERPTYRQVSSETTGHQEVVQVRFDPDQISYAELLRSYWRNVDPLDGGGQFCDRGDSYRPVIFTADAAQARAAEASAEAAARELKQPRSALKVELRQAARFWPAEGYHQNYAENNAIKYSFYRFSCGRDRRLDSVWGNEARGGRPWR
ncbi:peptide methionine sulfoxide reductase MsrA [Synechococcus sp. KORDI-52]|uniref:peptide-methionine (S)-S-oxide reductase MsrA n=1 Tax=Synechococcus sp. KORDI-52 TaxID=585425 RepID=UPI0004E0A215|nr:peptide-methionine (S)-S-oxide reductase MsrA [Synechococcus sp. KORDI-52]AII48599.1 peptide methionine sulfoxide reductase MsrA [Synechococcus sp. KORDI-52]